MRFANYVLYKHFIEELIEQKEVTPNGLFCEDSAIVFKNSREALQQLRQQRRRSVGESRDNEC
jgi:hypothetical protein